MDPLKGRRVGEVVAEVADAGVALFSAVWPRSMAKFEVERLTADGYAAGQSYDVDFSVALEADQADAAFPAMREAGFAIGGALGDGSRKSAAGFVTVHRRVRLRAYDLSRASTHLNRVASRFGGWAAVIGPTAPPPASSSSAALDAATTPVVVSAADAVLPAAHAAPAVRAPQQQQPTTPPHVGQGERAERVA